MKFVRISILVQCRREPNFGSQFDRTGVPRVVAPGKQISCQFVECDPQNIM